MKDSHNRVETERERPKLKFIYNKTKVRHLEESLLPISNVQYNIGGSISLLLARVSIRQIDSPDHNKQILKSQRKM